MTNIALLEVLIVAVIAFFLFAMVIGLIFLIVHLFRLTKRVQAMEERLRNQDTHREES
jgi:cbb3-type cytochrome oxidase subunit 3